MRKILFILLIIGVGLVASRFVKNRGEVRGISTVQAAELPQSLLPIEVYHGSPFARSSAEMLKVLNVTVYPEDVVRAFPDPALGIGSLITVYRATPVVVDDAGTKTTYRTWVKTVGDFLKEKAIEIGDKDKVSPALETELNPDLTIAITRVTVVEVTAKESIAFKTITKEEPSLNRGETRTEQKGQKGEKVLIYQVTRENGKEVGRKLVKTETTKNPVDEIIIKGTKEVLFGQGKATWFGAPALTAAHNSLPRGTQVTVVNLSNSKSVTVKVIGGGIRTNAIIDLSPDAFAQLAPLSTGVIQVKLLKP